MRVAIVHDFLVQMGGAEKVVEALHTMFPQAPIYTSLYNARAMPTYYRTWDIRTSFLQRFWSSQKRHRLALLLYPMAFESFDLSGYDLVISSSSAFAKGVVTHPRTTHVCYTHAPMRYAWTTGAYVQHERISPFFRSLLFPAAHYLRLWDHAVSSRVDHYIANSSAVADRIEKYYRRQAEIIFPPVATRRFHIAEGLGDYWILVARAAPYKRLDLAVEAFTRLGRRLKVVGTGRQMRALQAKAGPCIEFMGHVGDEELVGLLGRAQAFIMPGEEDFGIAAVEANACGRPVIAYAAGGALDSQRDGITGVLFAEQSAAALCAAVEQSDRLDFDPVEIRAHARRFDTQVFRCDMARALTAAHPALAPGEVITEGYRQKA